MKHCLTRRAFGACVAALSAPWQPYGSGECAHIGAVPYGGLSFVPTNGTGHVYRIGVGQEYSIYSIAAADAPVNLIEARHSVSVEFYPETEE